MSNRHCFSCLAENTHTHKKPAGGTYTGTEGLLIFNADSESPSESLSPVSASAGPSFSFSESPRPSPSSQTQLDSTPAPSFAGLCSFSTCFQLLVRDDTMLEHFLRLVGELFFFRSRSMSSSDGKGSFLIFSVRRLMPAPFSWTPLVTVFTTFFTLMGDPTASSAGVLTSDLGASWISLWEAEGFGASPGLMTWTSEMPVWLVGAWGLFLGTHFLGSCVGPPSVDGNHPVGSLACFFSLSVTHCCQLLVRLHTMLIARSFLMFLLLDAFLWLAWPACLFDIITSSKMSIEASVILLSNLL